MRKYLIAVFVVLFLLLLASLYLFFHFQAPAKSNNQSACKTGETAVYEGGTGWTCVKKTQITPMD